MDLEVCNVLRKRTFCRKYATGEALETALENSFESLVASVNKTTDGIVEIKELMLRLAYSFTASVCFGRQ